MALFSCISVYFRARRNECRRPVSGGYGAKREDKLDVGPALARAVEDKKHPFPAVRPPYRNSLAKVFYTVREGQEPCN